MNQTRKVTSAGNVAMALISMAACSSLLAACGPGKSTASPRHVDGTAAPADGSQPTTAADPSKSDGSDETQTAKTKLPAPNGDSRRCHTSELQAAIGSSEPGTGHVNVVIVLTNTSSRTCSVTGFPGVGFVDSAGHKTASDPQRAGGQKQSVSLAPGGQASSTLTWTTPSNNGAVGVAPAAVHITPPDERAFLTVPWSGGAVPKRQSDGAPVSVFALSTGVNGS
ncbi:DUF4232 domain-containing protein [Streptomyces sp. NPDC059215]|uniref:DUF4232 domain-containing protein n=1 Tax=Streptomyces sp. NPDC059215 TaxID=3346772 RepID=UPI0036AD6FC5